MSNIKTTQDCEVPKLNSRIADEDTIKFDFEDIIPEPNIAQTSHPEFRCLPHRDRRRISRPKNSDDSLTRENSLCRNQDHSSSHLNRSIMCRHWFRGMCWKGDFCEFMHQYDTEKFPICFNFQKTGRCEDREKGCCMFSHETPKSSQDAPICIHYFLGFCRSGPRCRKRHERLDPDKLPCLLPDWYLHLILSNASAVIPDVIDPETENLMLDIETTCRNLEGSNMMREKTVTKPDDLHAIEHKSHGFCALPVNSLKHSNKIISNSRTLKPLSHENLPLSDKPVRFNNDSSGFRPYYLNLDAEIINWAWQHGVPRLPGSPTMADQVGETRIFVIKSVTVDHIMTSIRLGVWATGKKNTKILEEAFHTKKHVVLLFSGNETGGFQGYAKMASPMIPDLYKFLWGNFSIRLGPNFRVQWLKQCRVEFEKFQNLVNPLNLHQSIRKARDCQEIPLQEASVICTILDRAKDEDLLKGYQNLANKPRIDHSTFFELSEPERVKKEIELGLRTEKEDNVFSQKSLVSEKPNLTSCITSENLEADRFPRNNKLLLSGNIRPPPPPPSIPPSQEKSNDHLRNISVLESLDTKEKDYNLLAQNEENFNSSHSQESLKVCVSLRKNLFLKKRSYYCLPQTMPCAMGNTFQVLNRSSTALEMKNPFEQNRPLYQGCFANTSTSNPRGSLISGKTPNKNNNHRHQASYITNSNY